MGEKYEVSIRTGHGKFLEISHHIKLCYDAF